MSLKLQKTLYRPRMICFVKLILSSYLFIYFKELIISSLSSKNTDALTGKGRNKSLCSHLVLGDGDDFSDFEQELDGGRRWGLGKRRAVFKLSCRWSSA